MSHHFSKAEITQSNFKGLAQRGALALLLSCALIVSTHAAAPANDNFANATPLSGNPVNTTGSTVGATLEPNEPNGQTGTIWYSYTAPITGRMTVSTVGSDFDTFLTVYTGTSLNALTQVAQNDDFNGNLTSQVSFTATANTNYKIQVDGFGSGNVALTVSVAPPPANDAFAGAIPLTGNPASVSGSNQNATVETGEPTPGPNGANTSKATVWYQYTVPSAGTVIISTTGSSIQTAVGVYTAATPPAVTTLTSVAKSANNSGPSIVSFAGLPGQIFYIQLDGLNGTAGNFVLGVSIVQPPSNDNFGSAKALNADPFTDSTGTTLGATSEPNEPATSTGRTIWYKWTAPTTRKVQFNTLNSSPGSTFVMKAYTGSALNALTQAPNGTNANPGPASTIQFNATAGTTYDIQVWDTGTPGNVTLNLPSAPANDDFANATPLTNPTFNIIGSTIGATKEVVAGKNEVGVGGNGFSIWYRWTAAASGPVRMDVSGSDPAIGATMGVFIAPPAPAVADATNLVRVSNLGTSVQFTTTANTQYLIKVDSTTPGSTQINLRANPGNDLFANAINIGLVNKFAVNGNNQGATIETAEPVQSSGGGATIWWKWTSPFTKNIIIDTNGSQVNNPVLGIYTETPPTSTAINTLTTVTSNGNTAAFRAVANTQYFIQADSRQQGSININLVAQPNDDFANATVLQGVVQNIPGNTTNAGKETGEPLHGGDAGGASVWYKYTAPAAGKITVALNGQFQQNSLAVYTGAAVNSLTLVAQAAPAFNTQVTFIAAAGTTYSIAVDQLATDVQNFQFGPFQLSINAAPSNDDFVNRLPVTGPTFSVKGTTIGATFEAPFEPKSLSGQTVWYTWTAPAAGTILLSTGVGGPAIDVYTGASLPTLTTVATSKGGSTATLTTVAGVVYQIRIDGPATDFTLATLAVPPNDNYINAITLTGAVFDVQGYTFGATGEPGETTGLSNSVWYKWTAPASAHVSFDVTGDVGGLGVFTGTAPNPTINQLAAVKPSPTDKSSFTFDATVGTTYYIAVGGGQGSFELFSNVAPPNDNFAAAIALSGASATVSGYNFAATKEAGEPNHNFAAGGQSVWYTWTAPNSGKAAVNVIVNGTVFFNPTVAVYTGAAVTGLTRVTSGAGFATFTAVAGTVYAIAVDGDGSGDFKLNIAVTPPNDDFKNAIALSGILPYLTTGSNQLATREPGEPVHAKIGSGSSVWWSFVAPESRVYEVSTAGSNFDTVVAVYTGTSVSALTPVAANNDANGQTITSVAQFTAVAGTTYYIAVDGSGASGSISQGNIALSVSQAVPTITSPLTASPVPQEAGKPVVFTVGADATATFTWDFGDGTPIQTSATGTFVHVYAAAGTYTATVTATVLNGTKTTSTVTVVVLKQKDLVVQKATITLNFSGKPGTDTIALSGNISVDTSVNTGTFEVKLGGFDKVYTLANGKLSPTSKTDKVTLSVPKATPGNAKFSVNVKGSFQTLFPTLTSAVVKNKAVQIPAQIIFNGTAYDFSLNLLYTSTGKKGTAK